METPINTGDPSVFYYGRGRMRARSRVRGLARYARSLAYGLPTLPDRRCYALQRSGRARPLRVAPRLPPRPRPSLSRQTLGRCQTLGLCSAGLALPLLPTGSMHRHNPSHRLQKPARPGCGQADNLGGQAFAVSNVHRIEQIKP